MLACAYPAAWLINHMYPRIYKDAIKCIVHHIDMITRAMIYEAMFNRLYGKPETMIGWCDRNDAVMRHVAKFVKEWEDVDPRKNAWDVARYAYTCMDPTLRKHWTEIQCWRIVEWIGDPYYDDYTILSTIVSVNNLTVADAMFARGCRFDNGTCNVTPENWRYIAKYKGRYNMYNAMRTLDNLTAPVQEEFISAFDIKFDHETVQRMIEVGCGLKYEPLWTKGIIKMPKQFESYKTAKRFIMRGYSIFGVSLFYGISQRVIQLPISNRDRAWVISRYGHTIKKCYLYAALKHIDKEIFMQNATPGSLRAVEMCMREEHAHHA